MIYNVNEKEQHIVVKPWIFKAKVTALNFPRHEAVIFYTFINNNKKQFYYNI